jgi:tRNA(Ser,Leu) C12 N-acetylase TAN1
MVFGGVSMEYAALVSRKFYKAARGELMSFLPDCKIKKLCDADSRLLLLIRTEREDAGVIPGFSYIDVFFPVFAFLHDVDPQYYTILENISNILSASAGKSFMIEVEKLCFKTEESAKDIEVRLGGALEARGFTADLKRPEIRIYVVVTGGGAVIGVESQKKQVLDAFRYFNKLEVQHLNRSEFKLIEAVEDFGIEIGRIKRCIDIGAAPGGWTHFLLDNGVKVLAIDSAPLAYSLLPKSIRILVLYADDSGIGMANAAGKAAAEGANITFAGIGEFRKTSGEGRDPFESYDLIHIMFNAGDKLASLLNDLNFNRFDMLAIDINRGPDVAGSLACSLSGLLKSGANLIMTVKMPEAKPEHYALITQRILSDSFEKISIRKLQHNRQELTAFAVRRS